jgi:TM2 domain-containing membrane protein YozV
VPEEGLPKECEGCGTPHHAECYEENGGCTLFGCKFAPADDPKVLVTSGDVSNAPNFGATVSAYNYQHTSGFGDVNAPLMVASPAVAPPPPPPAIDGGVASSPVLAQTPMREPDLFAHSAPSAHKSRVDYILLGIFLGALGVHNFYAGYKKRALIQLSISVGTLFFGAIAVWLWALVEICTVDRDANRQLLG